LVCSRIVSMTFVPLLGRYVLRPARTKELTLEEKRNRGFYGFYYRLVGSAITHRWTVLAVAAVCLILALAMSTGIKTQFFPDDVQYWSYVDIWLPNETPIARTDEVAHKAEQIIRRVTSKYQEQSKDREERGSPPLLKTLTSFVGGGSPRFWFSVTPQAQQANYAEILLQMNDKEATPQLMGPLQQSLSEEIPGAQIMVHQLQINPVEFPVEVRLSSTADLTAAQERADNGRLQILAEQAANILRTTPGTAVTQTDWLGYTPEASILVDSDKANISGITNQDVAASVETATTGSQVTTLRQGNREIPVLLRQAPEQRAQLSDLNNLYVASSSGSQKVPLSALSHVDMEPVNQRIRRQEQFRTIGVHAFPQSGVLPSVLLKDAMPALKRFQQTLPPGYQMVIGGESAKQRNGFLNLAVVLIISIIGIYAALLVQFDNAVKPFLVFAATPFGIAGALLALVLMHATFGFMAFLGIASLIGVIISHVIVLFDFIEEMHAQGEPIEQALRDAGIERLRPVLITVGATIFALFPLAIHGGPLWRPLCYAQMGGLAVATLITLLLVPVLYSIAVKDLGIIRWQTQIDAHVD
jgi:multidrug efflux pump subunit AcrB